MQEYQKTLLDLLGRALFGADVNISSDIDWSALYKESNDQTVTSLVLNALTPDEIALVDDETLKKWEGRAAFYAVRCAQLLYEQQSILTILKENNIPCAVLKGSSVAQNYPDPDLRIMGDIDILVPKNLQSKAAGLITGNTEKTYENDGHFHISVNSKNITVEIHNEPNGIEIASDENVKKQLRDFFSNALSDTQETNKIITLSKEHQAVSLLLHKLSHFLSEGIGLRQLCDWACFVNKNLDDREFKKIKPRLESFGLLEFAGVITRTCCDWLHLPVSCAKWCMEYDKDLSEEIIEQILTNGNFGRKENYYGQRLFTDCSSSNRLTSMFKVLKKTCKDHWPPCQKYPILMPIAPFVLLARYFKMRKNKQRPNFNLIKIYKKAGPKQKLYKSLKPFEIKKQ